MQGRLKRESNPRKGERAGYPPQHERKDGTFIETGENNPLPVNSEELKQELESIKTELSLLKNKNSAGMTIKDAPKNVANGSSFYAIEEGIAYLYFDGDWWGI